MSTKGIANMNECKQPLSLSSHSKNEIELSRIVKELIDSTNVTDRERIDKFMDQLGSLFLQNNQENILPTLCSESQLEKAYDLVELEYIPSIRDLLIKSFEYNEWDLVCIKRTNVEVFNSIIKDFLELEVDTEYIDDMIRSKSKVEGGAADKIKDNMPKSHWWWDAH